MKAIVLCVNKDKNGISAANSTLNPCLIYSHRYHISSAMMAWICSVNNYSIFSSFCFRKLSY